MRNLQVGTKLQDVSFDLGNGEVAGVIALEGQGQDELFGATFSGQQADECSRGERGKNQGGSLRHVSQGRDRPHDHQRADDFAQQDRMR